MKLRSGTQPIDTSLLTLGRLVVVGLGGIGSLLARYLTKYVSSLSVEPVTIVLVDGDAFEERNRERMDVPELGPKAVVLCEVLSEEYGRRGLRIRPVDRFVTVENARELIQEHDVVFSCVDNHATRKILSDRSEELSSIVLLSGGNDGVEGDKRGTYGTIQVFRRRGVDLNPPLTRFHPEIEEPRDEVPGPSCADLASTTAPQLLFTNLAAASHMLNAFYRLFVLGADSRDVYDEVCFDILEGRATPQKF